MLLRSDFLLLKIMIEDGVLYLNYYLNYEED